MNRGIVFILCCGVLTMLSCAKKEPSFPNRPEGYGTIIATITDEQGNPTNARVYAQGKDDSLYMADECLEYDRPGLVDMIGYTGRHFTTVGNTFTVHLPEGQAAVRLEKGKEFIPVNETIQIKAGKSVEKKFVMKRWIDMNAMGWFSGDLHVHRDLDDLGALLLTEDLNIATPQTVWGHHLKNVSEEQKFQQWLEKADSLGTMTVDKTHIFSVLSHEIERFVYSAVLLHHTGKSIMPVVEYNEKMLPNVPLFEMTHKAGGYVEEEKPWWPESHIDIAAAHAELVGIANNHFCYKGFLPEHPRHRDEFKSDYPAGVVGYTEYNLDLLYAYLNCGFKVMPSAGSASGVLPNPLGYNRMYVKVDGDFSYDAWFDAAVKGHSFVTNGPMLIMTVDNAQMGDTITAKGPSVHVACTINSIVPIDRLEIIVDGTCVNTTSPIDLKDNTAVIETDIPVSQTGWIAARCFEKIEDNVHFAQTSPVFVDVDGKPFVPKKYAVDYFLKKTKEVIEKSKTEKYPSEQVKKDFMKVYNKALSIYQGLAKKAK